MINQAISLFGALLILGSFAAAQVQRMKHDSVPYQLMNLIGGACVCFAAMSTLQYGVILLEGTWAVLSGYGLWRILRKANASS